MADCLDLRLERRGRQVSDLRARARPHVSPPRTQRTLAKQISPASHISSHVLRRSISTSEPHVAALTWSVAGPPITHVQLQPCSCGLIGISVVWQCIADRFSEQSPFPTDTHIEPCLPCPTDLSMCMCTCASRAAQFSHAHEGLAGHTLPALHAPSPKPLPLPCTDTVFVVVQVSTTDSLQTVQQAGARAVRPPRCDRRQHARLVRLQP